MVIVVIISAENVIRVEKNSFLLSALLLGSTFISIVHRQEIEVKSFRDFLKMAGMVLRRDDYSILWNDEKTNLTYGAAMIVRKTEHCLSDEMQRNQTSYFFSKIGDYM